MNSEQFADALQKGKGRAFTYVREHGDAGLEDVLLNACLHNLVYDLQCEGNRGPWLLKLVGHAKNPDYYYQAILGNFMTNGREWDISQQSSMLAGLARQSHPGAREALYRKFDFQEFNHVETIGSDIVELNGLDGMLHVVEVAGQRIESDPARREDNSFVNSMAELIGKEKLAQALEEAARNNPHVKAYLDEIIKTSGSLFFEESERPAPPPREKPSLQDFRNAIENLSGRQLRSYCIRFGRKASGSDIQELFAQMEQEEERQVILTCLWVFFRAELPEVTEKIMGFAASADKELQEAALDALANVNHPAVRKLAVELLEQGNPKALKLMNRNFSEGDFTLVAAKLAASADRDKMHECGSYILDLFGEHKNQESAGCLVWAYENTPCALCRNYVVNALIEINGLSAPLREECENDCYEDTRLEVLGLQKT